MLVAKPPTDEQQRIADELDRSLDKQRESRTRVETSIELLREYRAALITAAVTGQLRELL